MSEFLKQFQKGNRIFSILSIVFGALLIVWPGATIVVLFRIAGIVLLAAGVGFFMVSRRSEDITLQVITYLPTLICLVLGIWMLAAPRIFLSLIPVIIGLVMIYHALRSLSYNYHTRAGSMRMGGMIGSVVVLVLGLICLIHPWSAVKVILVFVGIGLVLDGIFNLLGLHRYSDRDGQGRRIIDVDYSEEK